MNDRYTMNWENLSRTLEKIVNVFENIMFLKFRKGIRPA